MSNRKQAEILSTFHQLKDEDQHRILHLFRHLELIREIDQASKDMREEEKANFLKYTVDNHMASAAA